MTILITILIFSYLNRHILDDNSKIVLSLIMQVEHSIYFILISSIVDKVNDRYANHDHIEDIHYIIVIAVIGLLKFYWRKFDKP